jgi:hypothetical protein
VSIGARIERVRSEDLLDEPVRARAPRGIGRRRQLAGLLVGAAGLPLLTLALTWLGDGLSLEGQVLPTCACTSHNSGASWSASRRDRGTCSPSRASDTGSCAAEASGVAELIGAGQSAFS